MALLSGVESLYRDRKKPFLGELQRRLKSSELWSNNELRAGAAVCALDASRYFLVPPFAGEPPCVLLRKPPPGFDEWFQDWFCLAPTLRGGVAGAAFALQEKCQRGLGELRAVLRVFLKKGLLRYDGDELLPSEVLEKELQQIQASPRTPKRRNARIYSQI
eukprot:g16002.t1